MGLTHSNEPKWATSILDAIGNTPLIHLQRLSSEFGCTVLGKAEYLNPGLSAKDRIAVEAIDQAEKGGGIRPGGTIIEATSGNTGFSLAMVCIQKGYKCILTTTDKSANEKVDQMRALGAEVIICPAKVASTDPKSYYSVAEQLNDEIPNSIYINQYFNKANADAHYKTTGPEIWNQTGGRISHYFAACGSGGTISGTARYLKEQNPQIKVIGVDAYGSVLQKYHETGELDMSEAYSYLLEGVGKKIIPGNVNFGLIDRFVKVEDRASAFQALKLTREEGIFAGYSCGAVVQALYEYREGFHPDDIVVVLLPDHGSKYMSKIYSEEWMRDQGFIEHEMSATADSNGMG